MSDKAPLPPTAAPAFAEFVGMIAACMALFALAIDSMLPALPQMGDDFGVSNPNHLQWIIVIFFIGGGFGQLIFGPLSDWLGRKRVLMAGFALYAVLSLGAAATDNLTAMIILRGLQGVSAAAGQVIARAIIRDRYSGSKMARVLSTAYVVYLLVPVLAPSLGQVLLLVMPWQGLFITLAGLGIAVNIWTWLRLPETRAHDLRHTPDLDYMRRAFGFIIKEPQSLFYTLAVTLLSGTLMSYISLMPQIFTEFFKNPAMLGVGFGISGLIMGVASLFNSRVVMRYGSKRMADMALMLFVGVCLIHFGWAYAGFETIASFMVLQSVTMGCMILCTSNFAALAMEKVGHISGTAASIQGVIATIGGAMIGSFIGQHWHGEIWLLPLGAGLCGTVALIMLKLRKLA